MGRFAQAIYTNMADNHSHKAQTHLSSIWASCDPLRTNKFPQESKLLTMKPPTTLRQGKAHASSSHLLKATHPLFLTKFCPVHPVTHKSATFHWGEDQQCTLETA